MRPETIAIDGPAGSGKSTIGQALAVRLHYAMVDTGLIYRLVARGVLDAGVDPDDRDAVIGSLKRRNSRLKRFWLWLRRARVSMIRIKSQTGSV